MSNELQYPGLAGQSGHLVWAVLALSVLWPVLLVAVPVAFVWFVVRPTVKAAWRHPNTAVVVVVAVALAVALGVVETAGLATGLALATAVNLAVWRAFWPVEFARLVSDPWHVRRRRDRLVKSWPQVMTGHGLAWVHTKPARRGPRQVTTVPALTMVSGDEYVDRLVVRPLPGQDLETWEHRTAALGLHLGAMRCRVALHETPGHLQVELVRRDRLARVVSPFPPSTATAIDLSAIPVGLREDGTPFTITAGDGQHLFIGGETKAGKSSYVWSILAALAPLVRLGVVRLWGIDPKCQEFPFGAPMFHRLATMANPAGMLDLALEAKATMIAKGLAMSGTHRTHVPTPDNPLDVLVVDEMGFLTAYHDTAKVRKEFSETFAAIATQGRTTGMWLIGAAQDPGKEVVPLRNLFPMRIALRLREASNVDMVLGNGMRAAGALCDQIPTSLRGVGYVVEDGAPEPVRVRAAYHDDPAVIDLATRFPAGRPLDVAEVDTFGRVA